MTDPWPDDATLAVAYGDWYRPDAGRFSGPGDWILRRSRGRVAVRVDTHAPPGPVLDVGAGDGTLVAALRARGREAIGLEREPQDAPSVVAGEIADVTEPQAAVVLWHSLEHLPDAAGALRDAAAALKPGGLLLVAIPNAASLQARLFGRRWFALDIPRHLFHIPADALTARLRELGLRVTTVSHMRGGQIVFGWLHGLVGVTGIDLYDAIRRPAARRRRLSSPVRLAALAAAALLLPVALTGAAVEVALRRGGTVMVEAVKG